MYFKAYILYDAVLDNLPHKFVEEYTPLACANKCCSLKKNQTVSYIKMNIKLDSLYNRLDQLSLVLSDTCVS
jgi:hypothetical protein